MLPELSQEEILRYSRHLMIPKVGLTGQKKIKNTSALIVGLGGLGSPTSLYLAAAGLGRIGLVDHDIVDISGLQRQLLYDMNALGFPKVEIAKKRLLDINPFIQVDVFNTKFTSENAFEISKDFDVLVDGTDNIPTRYLLNDLSVLTARPYVYGAVNQFGGQMSLFNSTVGPCYRCVFNEPPLPENVPSCADIGVFAITPGVIGLLQATEILKMILDIGETLSGILVLIDLLGTSFKKIDIQKNPNCKVCGKSPEITQLIDYAEFCGSSLSNKPVIHQHCKEIKPKQLAKRLSCSEDIHLIDIRQNIETQISSISNSKNIPYGKLIHNFNLLNMDDEYILICRTGIRSLWAQNLMMEAGFNKVWVLQGGINGWAQEVDPSIPQY